MLLCSTLKAYKIFTEEATQTQILRHVTILHRLRAIEENGSDLGNADVGTNALHLRAYDALVEISPFFKHRNPTLVEMLETRRRIHMRG